MASLAQDKATTIANDRTTKESDLADAKEEYRLANIAVANSPGDQTLQDALSAALSKNASAAEASTKADNLLNDLWNLGDVSGYSGEFIAANKININGTLSWADVQPDDTIKNINVESLNPTAILIEAKIYDGDIDGKSGAGTSNVREGEENFIFGASYRGTQGVSITEVSGISASIVHGKKVVWTDGDLLVKVDGKEYIKNIKTDKLATKTSAKLINSEIYALIAASYNIAAPIVSSNTTSSVQNTSTFSAVKNTLTVTPLSSDLKIAGINSTTIYSIVNHNIVNAQTLISTLNKANNIITLNFAKIRTQQDFTNLTAHITQGNFFNVANNTFETYKTALSLINERVNVSEISTTKIELDMKAVKDSIIKSGMHYQETKINIEEKQLEQRNIDTEIDKLMTSIQEGEIIFQKLHTSIVSSNIVVHP